MSISSPKLKVAIKEIESILAKHDIGGVVVLSDGDTHAEWRMFLDTPTWSMIRFPKSGKGIHFKGYMKSKPDETNMTTNMIIVSQDVLGRVYLMLDQIRKQIKDIFNTEEGKGQWADHEGNPIDD